MASMITSETKEAATGETSRTPTMTLEGTAAAAVSAEVTEPSEAVDNSDLKVIDLEKALELTCDGDKIFLTELLKDFSNDMKAATEEINTALSAIESNMDAKSSDPLSETVKVALKDVRMAAHRIKGVASYFVAKRMINVCNVIQDKINETAQLDKMEKFCIAYEDIKKHVDTFKKEAILLEKAIQVYSTAEAGNT